MRPGIHEIIKLAAEAETKPEKVAILQKNDSMPLRYVLRYAYDPRITWLLPEGDPPYTVLKEDEVVGSEFLLLKEARTFYMFVEGGDELSAHIKNDRRQTKFVELLEACHPEDAKIVLMMKNRNIPGVDKGTVAEAFPGLLGNIPFAEKVATAVSDKVAAVGDKVAAAKARRRERDRIKREALSAVKSALEEQH